MGDTTDKKSCYLGECRTRQIQPLKRSINIGKNEKGFRVLLLQPLTQRIMRNDPGNQGRVALHEVGLRLPPLQPFIPPSWTQQRGSLVQPRRPFRAIFTRLWGQTITPSFQRCAGLFFALLDTVGPQTRPTPVEVMGLIKLGCNPVRVHHGKRKLDSCRWRNRCRCQRIRIEHWDIRRLRKRCCQVQIISKNVNP